jgi:hypothetical protein
VDYTTTALLASIRRRASIPTTSTTGGADADLLAYANEELQLRLTADIMRLREEYFAYNSDSAISGTSYRVPKRAIGGKLRGVYLLDSSSNPLEVLQRIEPERVPDYGTDQSVLGFVVEGNNVKLVPSATTTASYLRLSYHIRPNELATTGHQAITVVDTANNRVTVSSTTGFTTSTPCDLLAGKPGFHHLAIDQTPTVVGSPAGTVTFSALPSGLAVGDYLALAEKGPIPQIPAEYHPILAQRVAIKYLQAGGYLEELAGALRELEGMEAAVGVLATPRVDGSPQKIINRTGAVSGAGWRYRYGPR